MVHLRNTGDTGFTTDSHSSPRGLSIVIFGVQNQSCPQPIQRLYNTGGSGSSCDTWGSAALGSTPRCEWVKSLAQLLHSTGLTYLSTFCVGTNCAGSNLGFGRAQGDAQILMPLRPKGLVPTHPGDILQCFRGVGRGAFT